MLTGTVDTLKGLSKNHSQTHSFHLTGTVHTLYGLSKIMGSLDATTKFNKVCNICYTVFRWRSKPQMVAFSVCLWVFVSVTFLVLMKLGQTKQTKAVGFNISNQNKSLAPKNEDDLIQKMKTT